MGWLDHKRKSGSGSGKLTMETHTKIARAEMWNTGPRDSGTAMSAPGHLALDVTREKWPSMICMPLSFWVSEIAAEYPDTNLKKIFGGKCHIYLYRYNMYLTYTHMCTHMYILCMHIHVCICVYTYVCIGVHVYVYFSTYILCARTCIYPILYCPWGYYLEQTWHSYSIIIAMG